jgi:hypothetical protein
VTKSEVEKLGERVDALGGREGELPKRAAKFHTWLREADFKSCFSVIGELTKDEQMPFARAIQALDEGVTLERQPEAERAAWVKAYDLYEKLEHEGTTN